MRSFPLLILLLSSCVRGHPSAAVDAGTEAVAAAAAGDDWTEGRLPPAVNEGTPRQGGTVVVRLQAMPPSLDLITDSDLITTWILDRRVYESLGELDVTKQPDYPLKPGLAESWEVSPDGRVLTFHIRHGVRWHDGAPFSGQDVVATIRTILDPKVRAMHLRNRYDDLESIDTATGDDFTVIARYRKPYFLALRSLATQPIYPKHVLDTAGDLISAPIHRQPVGTGPFKFSAWKEQDGRIEFIRNADYWGRPAWLDRVVYRVVKDPTVAYQLLLQKEFDLYTVLTPQQWGQEMPASDTLRQAYNRIRFYFPNYSWVGWNELKPMFADKRVRLALTYLLDREGIRQQYLLGVDRPTTCHFYPESSSCDQTLQPRPWDPEKGLALLDEAGWKDHDGDGVRDKDGVPFRFTFLAIASSQFSTRLGAYMQSELKKYGVDVRIRRVDWSIYSDLLRHHEFDACGLLWGQNDVVSDPYQIWHSSQAKEGSNYISFRNPRADQLIEQARGEMDDEKRAALYREFGRLLYEENPYTFLYNRPQLDVVRKNVHGIRPAVTWYDLQDVWLSDP